MIQIAAIAGRLGLSRIKLILIVGLTGTLMVLTGGLYMKGRLDAVHARELKDLRSQHAAIQRTMKRDLELALDHANQLQQYEEQVVILDDYIATLPDRDAECLSATDTSRLQQLWK